MARNESSALLSACCRAIPDSIFSTDHVSLAPSRSSRSLSPGTNSMIFRLLRSCVRYRFRRKENIANRYESRSEIFVAPSLSIVSNVEERAASQHSVVMLFGSRGRPGVLETRLVAAARAAGHSRRDAFSNRASLSVGALPESLAANNGQFSSIVSPPRNSEEIHPFPVEPDGQSQSAVK